MKKNKNNRTKNTTVKATKLSGRQKVKLTVGQQAKALLADLKIDISEFARRHNNSVIAERDGEFTYGTSEGETYGDFATHEEYVRGDRALFNARTKKVKASIDRLVKAKRIDGRKARIIVAGMQERGQIA